MRRPLRSDEARAIANLAIDLGDPGRMAKARRLHRANGVSAVDIDSGVARLSVTDADGEIFDIDVEVVITPAPGGLPSAEDLVTTCSCDDHGDACMHALAGILGIAEEVEANTRVLDLWTGAERPTPRAAYVEPTGEDEAFFSGRWNSPARIEVAQLPRGESPMMVVDDVDAGPVILDAQRAITETLRRYRARA